tara:strand:+ start:1435 stop:2250 length:816 start_codon:yes stop_codon:yes gene_type:complete
MSIPKILHQLWIGDKPMPSVLMDKVKSDNEDCKYMLWNEELIKSKLKINKKYQQKIDLMEEINGKADMYRWLILYEYGGVFMDADNVSIEPLDDFLFNKSFVGYENEKTRGELLACGTMGFSKEHIIPEYAINHILNNRIVSPAWKSVGNMLLTQIYQQLQNKDIMNIYPSYYFLPEHYTGEKYKGHGKVYTTHYWGSTLNMYDNMNEIKLDKSLTIPNKYIEIEIPNVEKKELKEILNGIKSMEGHFIVRIICQYDIDKFLKNTRFIIKK